MVAQTSMCDTEDDPSFSMNDREGDASCSGLDLEIDISDFSVGTAAELAPAIEEVGRAVLACHENFSGVPVEAYCRIVGAEESHQLNAEYRGKDKPTNVLSFPGCEADELDAAADFASCGGPPVMLGDIIIAGPVVVSEAAEQGKPVLDHFRHLLVHGLLHLLGYDHMADEEAERMEALERKILSQFGVPDPYESDE